MSAMPWAKFFWADWESDECLKLCSPGAQALWMRMLCVCAKAEGYLVIADRKLGADDMAKLTGWAASDVQTWWAELRQWGVFSVEGRSKVFCRRMVRDRKRAQTARENGSKGGNPNLGKQREIGSWDNQKPTDTPTNPPGTRARLNQKPEARSQKEEEQLFLVTSEKTDRPLNGHAVPARASRLPQDWRPTQHECDYAASVGLYGAPLDREIENFRDYWHAKAGKDATKVDWAATWRRWARTAGERNPKAPAGKPAVDWC